MKEETKGLVVQEDVGTDATSNVVLTEPDLAGFNEEEVKALRGEEAEEPKKKK